MLTARHAAYAPVSLLLAEMSASAGTTHQSLQLIDLADASGSVEGTSRPKLGVSKCGLRVPQSVSIVHAGEPVLIHVRGSSGILLEKAHSRQGVRLDADSVAEVGHVMTVMR